MTIQEICNDWVESSSNIDGKELSVRTFHRYREEIANLFGIEIECDKADGYHYFIRRDRYADTEISEWLLSSLRMASLGDKLKYHNKVMLEKAPENTQYLDDIISAIDKHYAIRFHYRTPYGDEMEMELVPAFLRLFRQRWYVIGNLMEQNGQAPKPNADGSDYHPRVLPFDRISYLEIVCERQLLSKKTKELLSPDNFYEGCFGIIRQQNLHHERYASVPSIRRTTTSGRCRSTRARPRYTMPLMAHIPTMSSLSVPLVTSSRNCCGTAVRSSSSVPTTSARR